VISRFLLRRVLQAVPVVLGVTIAVFLIIHVVPGDPAQTALGPRASPADVHALREKWGLNASLPTQFVDFMGRLGRGDLGTSLTYDAPTTSLIVQRLPVTIWLLAYSVVLILLLAVPLAFVAAARPGRGTEHVVRVINVAGLGLPSFWVGILFIQVFAVRLHVFPPAGFGTGVVGHLRSMFLPSFVLAISVMPLVTRSLRAEMLKVTQADYVVTARAKGLSDSWIRWRHIFRNALVPAVAVLTVNVGFLIGATVVVEDVFALPGLGQLMLQGIQRRDFQVVEGVTLALAIGVILVTIISDLVTSVLDRRIALS
jgi:ABC-type dipeptide/oligopeptide/nickel transport system permease component